ncbi:MAG: F0F1 ATP synthase subunit delta [Clostridia bacterium]|nr:F0F1 ATP synthase subunit delta [Clostridia bacterium]
MKTLRVLSSKPLSQESKEKIEILFRKKVEGQADFVYEIDESLIGGIKVFDGSIVYDGTISGKLEQIKQSLR